MDVWEQTENEEQTFNNYNADCDGCCWDCEDRTWCCHSITGECECS